jgi:hypothetical protein
VLVERDFYHLKKLLTDHLKNPNLKFHENPSVGSRSVPCRRTDLMVFCGRFGKLGLLMVLLSACS